MWERQKKTSTLNCVIGNKKVGTLMESVTYTYSCFASDNSMQQIKYLLDKGVYFGSFTKQG